MQNQKTSRKPKKSNQYSISLAKVEKQKKREKTKTSTKKIKETIFQKSGERVYSQESWKIVIFSLLVFLVFSRFFRFLYFGLPRVQEYCCFRLFLIFVFFLWTASPISWEATIPVFFWSRSLQETSTPVFVCSLPSSLDQSLDWKRNGSLVKGKRNTR